MPSDVIHGAFTEHEKQIFPQAIGELVQAI